MVRLLSLKECPLSCKCKWTAESYPEEGFPALGQTSLQWLFSLKNFQIFLHCLQTYLTHRFGPDRKCSTDLLCSHVEGQLFYWCGCWLDHLNAKNESIPIHTNQADANHQHFVGYWRSCQYRGYCHWSFPQPWSCRLFFFTLTLLCILIWQYSNIYLIFPNDWAPKMEV